MAQYGYVRISTPKQKIERQIKNITEIYPDAKIIEEVYTGTTIDRPRFNRLTKSVKPGDTIIFDEVSRMSRDAEEGFRLYEELFQNGVELVFLKEPHINTATYKNARGVSLPKTGTDVDIILQAVDTYLLKLAKNQIELAFKTAQAEVDLLHKRTRDGVAMAKKRAEMGLGNFPGRQLGSTYETAKQKANIEHIRKMAKRYGGNMTNREAIETLKLNPHTYYKYCRIIDQMIENEAGEE